MNATTDIPVPSDEQLVAYLDGELPLEARRDVNRVLSASDEARSRLEFLRAGDRPFAEALDGLLDQAPVDRLSALLPPPADAVRTPQAASVPASGWMPMAAAAAVLVALIGGFVGGMLAPFHPLADKGAPVPIAAAGQASPPTIGEAVRGWRQAVADYQMLFTTDSLTPYQGGDAGLELANAAVGLSFDPLLTNDGELNFRRIQVLEFNGKTLVQIAYLSVDEKPVSFCVIASGKPELDTAFEKRNGLGIVHWIDGGYGFMVIGDVPEARLADMAAQLRQKLNI
ncbi:anti-sigma factor family protein [Minwuia sp.]|uniref:anti-sigma factor family protein n=1 Tax=Minwuia sp. TaxID=2493630 RepID=UPI003A8D13D0